MLKILTALLAVVIFGVTGLGIWDYAAQAAKAGRSVTGFGLAAWAESFAERGRSAGLQNRQGGTQTWLASMSVTPVERHPKDPIADHFPQGSSEWRRVGWNQAHDYLFYGRAGELTDAQLKALGTRGALSRAEQFRRLSRRSPTPTRTEAADRTAVYQSGRWVVAITASQPRSRFAYSMLDRMIASEEEAADKPAALIQGVYNGVAFRDVTHLRGAKHGRMLSAMIGDKLELRVYTNASDAAVRRILSWVDYAAINRQVGAQVEGIGAGASSERHRSLQAEMRAQRSEAAQKRSEDHDRMKRKLRARAERARSENWLTEQVCMDHMGQQYCRSVGS
ncbi:MAG: hypothetical protein QNJ09_17770 [Paracoccaceae bacterium]|nr:hypothetical protein [Paracoccaceae bacterium]